MSAWTPDRVEIAKRLWREGLSAAQIAKQLGGVSRCAVIGKLHREGAAQRSLPSKPARIAAGLMSPDGRKRGRSAKPKAAPKPRPNNFLATNIARKAITPVGPDPIPAPLVFDATMAKPWTERKFGECAYPISGEGADTFSCCQPTGGTYCKAHQRIMFDRRPQTLAKSKSMQRWAGRVA